MQVFIQYNPETKEVVGWGTTRSTEHDVELDLERNDPLLLSFSSYLYVDGNFVEDTKSLLATEKAAKAAELNAACNASIIHGFDHTVNGVMYHFSFDTEAQLNFQGVLSLFDKGIIQSIMWTVSKDGEYMRIPISKTNMDEISMAILRHKDSNVSKYRDFLLPLLEAATTIEEVQSIRWTQGAFEVPPTTIEEEVIVGGTAG